MDRTAQRLILDRLDQFAAGYSESLEAELLKTGKLKKLDEAREGFYRLRPRTFRVIYKKYPERLVILVMRVSHRKEIYETR